MAFHSAAFEAAAGDGSFPFAGIYAASGSGGIVREIKCFTELANAALIRIRRATTAGTWTAEEEIEFNEDMSPPLCTVVKSAVTSAPTMGDPIDFGAVGAAIASGFHYTYYGEGQGLFIPPGTGNGIVLIEAVNTANTYSGVFIWEE